MFIFMGFLLPLKLSENYEELIYTWLCYIFRLNWTVCHNCVLMAWQTNLQAFMETSIGRVKTTLQALHLLDRFSRLDIKKLGIEEKYRQLFLQFGDDIEAVKHVGRSAYHY